MSNDLHGNVPDSHPVAVLLVDVINPCEFPEADDFLRLAIPTAENIAALKRKAATAGVPMIYANDNFGRWRSDLKTVVQSCMAPDCKGRRLSEILQLEEEDYFVLKPKHSAFYSTTLDLLLRALGTRTLVVCGFATNICVLFTANDAYMRDFKLVVPVDCVAANTTEESDAALDQMAKVLKANVNPSNRIDLSTLAE